MNLRKNPLSLTPKHSPGAENSLGISIFYIGVDRFIVYNRKKRNLGHCRQLERKWIILGIYQEQTHWKIWGLWPSGYYPILGYLVIDIHHLFHVESLIMNMKMILINIVIVVMTLTITGCNDSGCNCGKCQIESTYTTCADEECAIKETHCQCIRDEECD